MKVLYFNYPSKFKVAKNTSGKHSSIKELTLGDRLGKVFKQ